MNELERVWNSRVRFAGRGSHYVQISKEEFEEWLNTTEWRGKWKLQSGTAGIYLLPLSPKVAIKISSSMASRGEVVNYARGSIKMSLISLITGHTLNKKAQGQSHYKRTKNWRKNLKKGLDNFKSVYLKSKTFYDTIASVEDRDKYQRERLSLIESAEGWENNKILKDFHEKLSKGYILTPKQESLMHKLIGEIEENPRGPSEPLDEELLNNIRSLWFHAKRSGDRWVMDFAHSVGEQYKNRGSLSSKQKALLEKKFKQFGVGDYVPEKKSPTQKQIKYTLYLLSKFSDREWFDIGEGTDKPTKEDLEGYSRREISTLIDELKQAGGRRYAMSWDELKEREKSAFEILFHHTS